VLIVPGKQLPIHTLQDSQPKEAEVAIGTCLEHLTT